MKEKDLKFIKAFSEITVAKLCRELVIDKANLYHGLVRDDKIHELKEILKQKLEELLRSDKSE